MPQSEDKNKVKRRLAERRRMEKIREDPEKYAQWKLKMKEVYLKRKREGKIVSLQKLSPKQQKIARKKSRESSRRWYAKKKLKECDIHAEEEIFEECYPVVKSEVNDPLDLELPKSPEVSIVSRPPEIPSSSRVECQVLLPSARITRSTIRQNRTLGIHLDLKENEPDVSFNAEVPSRIKKSPLPNTLISDSLRTPSPQSSTASSPQRYIVSPKVNKNDARETSVGKKSSWKHILRRLKYRYHKELQLKDRKILELKRVIENYRKKTKRLQKDKRGTDVHKGPQKNLSENEEIHLVIEPCATGIKDEEDS